MQKRAHSHTISAHAHAHLPARTRALRHTNDTCKDTHTSSPNPHPPAYEHTLKRAYTCTYSPSLANCQIQAGTPPRVLHVYISSVVHQFLNDLTISCSSVQIVSIRTLLLFAHAVCIMHHFLKRFPSFKPENTDPESPHRHRYEGFP